jgi:hypothetical protein
MLQRDHKKKSPQIPTASLSELVMTNLDIAMELARYHTLEYTIRC